MLPFNGYILETAAFTSTGLLEVRVKPRIIVTHVAIVGLCFDEFQAFEGLPDIKSSRK